MMYKLTDLDPRMRPTQFTVKDVDKMVTAYKYLMEKHPEIALYDYRTSQRLISFSQTENIVIQDYTETSEEINPQPE